MSNWKQFLPIRCRAALVGLMVAVAAPALALSTSPLQPPKTSAPPPWRPPAIVLSDGQAQPIQLKAVAISTVVFGGQAQTRIEMRLFNPNARVLEGELQFPLLEGQVVTGFALDVNGTLRDAVPVPKARGQEIFEDIRRRRVDPGLLEMTAGNQYKLRVYPIPAHGERRVQLTVTETLPVQRGAAMLRMPLAYASAVGEFTVQLRVPGATGNAVQLIQGPAGVRVNRTPDGMEVSLQRQQWAPAGTGPAAWLQVAVKQAASPQLMVGESSGKRYFTARVPFPDQPVRRADPSHIALVWDASASGATQNKVLPILDTYFRSLQKPVQVSLIVVRNRVELPRSYAVAAGQWDELLRALRAEPYDGASNFDNLPIPADVDTTVMVTDGLATDGRRLINYTHAAPVLVINGSASADLPRLSRLAERTGGALIDATLLATADAAQAMRQDGWRIERLSSLAAVHLATPTHRLDNGFITVAGEMNDVSARVDVGLRHPDGRQRVVPIDIRGAAAAGRWPAQQWAQWHSRALAENPSLHRAQLQEMAAAHGIVGRNSSLIVLESAADYARYELPAPADLADQVAQLRGTQLTRVTQQRQAHLEGMVRQFDARQAWWDKDFPKEVRKPEPVPESRDVQLGAAVGETSRRRAASASPQSSPVPVAPMAAAAADAPAPASAPAAGPTPSVAAAKTSQPTGQQGTIALQGWTADALYMKRLQDANASELYDVYLDERRQNANSSAFYMDAAALFFERGQTELALRILSNLAEMNLENRQLLRMYGYRLVQARRNDLAVPVFERISELAPNEPQSWRDLGLALAESGQSQLAVNALWEVVSQPWSGRFAGVGMIALAELNAIAAQAQFNGHPLDTSRVDSRLRRNLPLGLRVVMAWDTDDTDIDLWVTDSLGEIASYRQRLTYQGGAMSPDATGGYGPEEFALRQARPGKYVVQAQFYGHRQQVLSAGTTVMVRVTTGFGTPQSKDEWLTLRLTSGQQIARIGEIEMQ